MVPAAVALVAVSLFGSRIMAAAKKGCLIISLVLTENRLCLFALGAKVVICDSDIMDWQNQGK